MRLADVGRVETRELRYQHGTLQDDRYLSPLRDAQYRDGNFRSGLDYVSLPSMS